MTLRDVLEAQLETAIGGLMRARADIVGETDQESSREIYQQLETVSHHIQDIQYNWLSLAQIQRARGPLGNRI